MNNNPMDTVTEAVNNLGRALRGEVPEPSIRKIDKIIDTAKLGLFHIVKFVKKLILYLTLFMTLGLLIGAIVSAIKGDYVAVLVMLIGAFLTVHINERLVL